jgi:hypothetical protein
MMFAVLSYAPGSCARTAGHQPHCILHPSLDIKSRLQQQ